VSLGSDTYGNEVNRSPALHASWNATALHPVLCRIP
jgi:hypothetical protein